MLCVVCILFAIQNKLISNFEIKTLPDKTKTKIVRAFDLPNHVLADVNTWIVEYTSIRTLKEDQEWCSVIDISLLLKAKLEAGSNHKVMMTREVVVNLADRVQLPGKDKYSDRRKVVNDNKANYFISIHCDGQASFKHTGAFVVIPRNVDSHGTKTPSGIEKSRQLGLDIMNNYSVISPTSPSVIQVGEEKSVLRKEKSAERRVIIELGRMTNPHDILKLYAEGNKDLIAEQLKNGILYNINNNYE